MTVVSTNKGMHKIAEGCDNCCTYCVIPSLGFYKAGAWDIVCEHSLAKDKRSYSGGSGCNGVWQGSLW